VVWERFEEDMKEKDAEKANEMIEAKKTLWKGFCSEDQKRALGWL
jgi:hypothetical protein